MTVIFPADRPRLQRSLECQRDALVSENSALTRLSCAFDAMYLCFVEVAEAQGADVVNMEHPSVDTISLPGSVLGLASGDIALAQRLCDWCQHVGRLFPEPCSPERALALAGEVYQRTLALLGRAATTHRSDCGQAVGKAVAERWQRRTLCE